MPKVASNLTSAIAYYLKGQHYADTDMIAQALNQPKNAIIQELEQMCADGIVLQVANDYWGDVPGDRRSR